VRAITGDHLGEIAACGTIGTSGHALQEVMLAQDAAALDWGAQ
jgi:hypothetical protein